MAFTQSITTCLSKYATFSGTASRSEFWWFALFTQLLTFAAVATEGFIYTLTYGQDLYNISNGLPPTGQNPFPPPDITLGAIFYLVVFATSIPLLSAGSRRLHDMGNSGWWQLLYLTLVVPTSLHNLTYLWIGVFPLVIMFAINTKDKDNRFKPKSRRSTS